MYAAKPFDGLGLKHSPSRLLRDESARSNGSTARLSTCKVEAGVSIA